MKKGFTLIEILVAITIMAIIGGIIFSAFSRLNSRKALDASANLVVSVLDQARSTTLASRNASSYGVYFGQGEVVIFPGVAYSAGDLSNVTTNLHQAVGIRGISFAGGSTSVVFERLTGGTTSYGSVEVFLRSAPDTYKTISISPTGVATVEGE
jgi:prepilin-type N-terminal cleavage/methylation domain-containing protein